MELFSNNLIRIIGNSGSEGKGENQFAQPRGICMDAKTKEVFIVDCNNHRVQVYHLNSLAYIRQIGKGDKGATKGNLNYPVGICMDDHHDIFVADTNNNRIAVFNRVTGVHVRSIGSKGTLVGLLNSPYGVCLDLCSNLLYVADYDNHRVQAFDKETGDFVKTVGNGYGDGPGQLNQPIVICIDYDSNQILVADYSNNRITVFHRLTGSYIKSIGETDGPNKLHGPRGVCLSKESNLIFVSDRENHRVQMYNRETHAFIRNIGGDGGIGSNPGQFNRPMELCVNAEEGVLLVVDGYNHRVQVIELMELQLEKLRLKAIAQSKADAILRGKNIPRPSLLAVCTAVDIHSIVQFDALSCAVQVKHPFLDPVFDASLTIDETVLLLTHLQSLLTTTVSTSNDAPRLLRTDETAGSNNTSLHQQMVRQSDIFMSILEELQSSAFVDVEGQSSNGATAGMGFFDPTFYRLSSPALFALKSLLSRGWKPTVFSEGIIKLLIAFVSNVDCCIVDSNERVQVLSALTSILFAVVRMNSTAMNTVLDCILQRLDCATKFSSAFLTHSKASSATADDTATSQLLSPATATSSYNITVLTAYFDILGSIASIEVAKRVNAVYEAKHQNPDLSKKSTALRNYVLDFIFGLSFMSSLHNCISSYRCNRSVARRNENLQRSLRLLSEGEDSSSQGADPPVPPLINNNNSSSSNLVYTMLPLGLREVLQLTFEIHSFRRSNQAQYATIIDVNQLDMSSKVDGMSQAYSSAFESQLSHRQAKLFSLAVGYLHNLRMQERTTERKVDVDIRSRGGRNIWRPDEPLSVGDLVDCMDKEKCWFESIVQELMSDGSIKVHFMGWGSKWDDIVTSLEVPIRIAPLNSKTKNWRADLFEGGLIEIKCNDDLINQKWMWGKVTSLNVDEAWVEVSYSFSNEPTLVKRAWLFGETICPVGMHTKDKSKAAAALIIKPLKKIEDIIKEKSQQQGVARQSDELFVDDEDEFKEEVCMCDMFEGALGGALPSKEGYPGVCSVGELMYYLHSSKVVEDGDPYYGFAMVGLSIMQCIMDELVYAVSSDIDRYLNSTHPSCKIIDEDTSSSSSSVSMNAAMELVSFIASTSYKRLLIPFFIRVLTFKAGMKVKVIASGFLSNTAYSSFQHSSSQQPIHSLLQVIGRFKYISEVYNTSIIRYLNRHDSLSTQAIKQISCRIVATVERCGTSQVANDFVDLLSRDLALNNEVISNFMNARRRFTGENSKLRKLLSSLLRALSHSRAIQFQYLVENFLFKYQQTAFSFTPQLNERGIIIDLSWALQLVVSVNDFYDDALSITRQEFVTIQECSMSAARSLLKFFNHLPTQSIHYYCQALAMSINALLDTSLSVDTCEPSVEQFLVPTRREQILIATLRTQKVIMSGELLKIFEPLFETLMGSRLLRGAYANIAIEKNCLESMPLMSNPLRMLHDLAQTSFYSIEFGKYMMHRVDSDDLQLSPVIDLILNKRQVAISVINSQLWSPCTRIYMQLFNRLVLPTQLSSIQNHFNDFYHYHYASTITTTHKSAPSPRRLVWCHGLGAVTLSYRRSDGRSRSIVVNEVQAAVLFLFNGPVVERTVMEIITALHLDIHQLKAVVYSMAVRSKTVRPILEICSSSNSSSDDDDEEKSFHWNSVVRLLTDEACYGAHEEMDYSMLCLRCIDPIDLNIVRDWRNDKLDVYIIKILKAASRSSCSSHLMELKAHHGSISTYELVEMVNREVIRVVLTGKDSSKHLNQVNSIDAYSIDEVITRAEHLVSIGCIDKVSEPEQSDGAIYNTSYVYMSSSSSTSTCTSTTTTTSTSTSTPQQKENCDELPLFDRMQQLLAEYNYNNNTSSNDKSLLLSEESVEPGTDNSSYSSHGDGEDKTDDFREETRDAPLGGLPSSSVNAVVDVDYFSVGLINWVSSVCPNRTLPKLIRGGYPRVMTNDHTRTALYTSESLVESATDSQPLCGFTDPSSIPPINEEESKTHPAVGSRPSLSHSTSSRQTNRISIPERSMGGSDGRKTVLSFPALYPQSNATSCSRADYFRQHESALETIHESSVYALGTLIQQVNLLLHEYSLNYYYESMDGDSYQQRRRKRSFRIDPPSINTYITSLFKYFECARTRPRTTPPSAAAAAASSKEEDEVFEDNCELQKWLFFALPLDLTRHICDQFTRILINYSSNNLSSIAALREMLSDPMLSSSSSSSSRSTKGGEMDDCIIHLDLWKRNWLKTFDINFGQLSPTRIDGDTDTGSSSDGSDRRASPTALRMVYVWYVDNRNALETKQLAGISLCDFLCTCLVHANRTPSSSTLDHPLVYNRIFGGYPVDDALHSSGGSFVDSLPTSSSNPFGTYMDSCSLRFSGTTGQQRRKCKPRLKAPLPPPPHHAQHSLMLSDRMEMMTMPPSLRQDRGLLLPSPDRSQLRGNTQMGLRDEAANYVSLSTYARNPSFVERSKDTMNSDRTTIIYSDGIYSSRHPSLKSVDSSYNREGSSGIYSYPLEGHQTRGATTQCSSSRDAPLRDLVARYLTVFHSSLWETFAADLNRLPSTRLSAIISADLRPELDELCHELLRSMSIRVASFIDTCRSSSTIPTDNHSPDAATASTKLWFLRSGISCSLDNILQEAFSFLDSDNDGLLDERDFKHREATTLTKSDPDKRILKATTTSSSSSPIQSTHRISSTCCDDNSSLSGHCYVSYEMMSSIDKNPSSYYSAEFIIRRLSTILDQPWDHVGTMLVHYRWQTHRLIEDYLSESTGNISNSGFEFRPQTSFLCLATSKADSHRYFFFSGGGDGDQDRSVRCSTCGRFQSPWNMYALSCRHFSCVSCWIEHMQKEIERNDSSSSISCVSNMMHHHHHHHHHHHVVDGPRSSGCCNHVTDTQFVTLILAEKSENTYLMLKYLQNRLRLFIDDFKHCQSTVSMNTRNGLLQLYNADHCFPNDDLISSHSSSLLDSSSASSSILSDGGFLYPRSRLQSVLFRPSTFSPDNNSRNGNSNSILSDIKSLPHYLAHKFSTPKTTHTHSTEPMSESELLSSMNVQNLSTLRTLLSPSSSSSSSSSSSVTHSMSNYICEAKLYMENKRKETVIEIECSSSEIQFLTLTNKLWLLKDYLRSIYMIQFIQCNAEDYLMTYDMKLLVDTIQEIILVTNINIKSKWNNELFLIVGGGVRESLQHIRLLLKKISINAIYRGDSISRSNNNNSNNPPHTAAAVSSRPFFVSSSTAHSHGQQSTQAAHLLLSAPTPVSAERFGRIQSIISVLNTGSMTMHGSPYSKGSTGQQGEQWSSDNDYKAALNVLQTQHDTMNKQVLIRTLKMLGSVSGISFLRGMTSNDHGISRQALVTLLSVLERRHLMEEEEDSDVTEAVLSVLATMCEAHSVLCRSLIDHSVWTVLASAINHHRNDEALCAVACRLMKVVLDSSPDNRNISVPLFYNAGMLLCLHRMLEMHATDFKTCLAVVHVFALMLENTFSMESPFVALGVCDSLFRIIVYFIDHPSMKMLLVVCVGRLTIPSNKYMQDKMVQLGALIQLLGIIYHSSSSSKTTESVIYDCYSLVKWSTWAVCCIIHKNHFTQTKFATIGGCKVILYTLQLVEDLSTVIYIMRTIAVAAMHNAYIQDSLRQEKTIELLQSKFLTCQTIYAATVATSGTHSEQLKTTYSTLVHTYQYTIDAVSGAISVDIDFIVNQTNDLLLLELDNKNNYYYSIMHATSSFLE